MAVSSGVSARTKGRPRVCRWSCAESHGWHSSVLQHLPTLPLVARRSTDHNILVLHPWNSQVVIPPCGMPLLSVEPGAPGPSAAGAPPHRGIPERVPEHGFGNPQRAPRALTTRPRLSPSLPQVAHHSARFRTLAVTPADRSVGTSRAQGRAPSEATLGSRRTPLVGAADGGGGRRRDAGPPPSRRAAGHRCGRDGNDDEGPPPANRRRALGGCVSTHAVDSALAGLEPGILLVDHVGLAATTDNLGARLVLQRPKGLADLHVALLRLSGRPRWPPTRLGITVRHVRPRGRMYDTQLVHRNGPPGKNSNRRGTAPRTAH